jgi:hypothetical protein
LISQVLLGSRAVYRVCSVDERLVEVETVSAPGLKPGYRLRLTREAAARMDLLDSVEQVVPRPASPLEQAS